MRTTIEFDNDTAAAVAQLRRERGFGVSEAVNELLRRGLLHEPTGSMFIQETRRLGVKIDVSNVAEALDVLDGPDNR